MRRLARALLLLLCLYGSAAGDITDYYVELTDATTGNAGTTGDPFSWADVVTRMNGGAAAAGDRYYIRGSVTLTSTSTFTNDGTATSPIMFVGCTGTGTTWTPITPTRSNGSGALVLTNHPVITYNGNYSLVASTANYLNYVALSMTSAAATATLNTGFYSTVFGCSIRNSTSNAAAQAIYSRGHLINSDFSCSGATTGACVSLTSQALMHGCVISDSGSYGVNFLPAGVSPVVLRNVFYGCTDFAIFNNITSTAQGNRPIICDNTIYGKGYGSVDAAHADPVIFLNNHITDGSTYAITGPATQSTPVFLANNRTRDNTSGAVSWNGDWDEATTLSHVTTDNGWTDGTYTHQTDYVNALTGDFRLVKDAAGVGQGIMGSDIGAIQRPEPTFDPTYLLAGATVGDSWNPLYGNVTLPLEANVWYGSGAFGARYLYLGDRLGTIGEDGGNRYFTSYRQTLPASTAVGTWINVQGKYARIAAIDGAECQLDNVAGDFPANGTGYLAGFYTAIAGSTPAMRASDITVTNGAAATLTAPDVKAGVIVDDVTGSLSGGGLTAQESRDAMQLAPTEAVPSPGDTVDTAQKLRDAMQLAPTGD